MESTLAPIFSTSPDTRESENTPDDVLILTTQSSASPLESAEASSDVVHYQPLQDPHSKCTPQDSRSLDGNPESPPVQRFTDAISDIYITPTTSNCAPETAYMHGNQADLLSQDAADIVKPPVNLASASDAHYGKAGLDELQYTLPSSAFKCSGDLYHSDMAARPSGNDTGDGSSYEDVQMFHTAHAGCNLSFTGACSTHTALPDSPKIVDPALGHSDNASNCLAASSTEALPTRELDTITRFHSPSGSPPAAGNSSSLFSYISSPHLHQLTHYPSSPCSPLPSSSPPRIFSSSPPSNSRYSDTLSDNIVSDCITDENLKVLSSPPSSPLHRYAISDADILGCDLQNVVIPKKNAPSKSGEADTGMKPGIGVIHTGPPIIASNKRKRSVENIQTCSTLPANKRPTLACQKISHRKLASPFKPPAMKEPTDNRNEAKSATKAGNLASEPITTTLGINTIKSGSSSSFARRAGTKRATAQFKSPLTTRTNGSASLPVRLTPTIQALQRDVQTLKRAVKVKQNGEEEELGRLVRKWTEAGREVAYELWALVKDTDYGAKVWIKGDRDWEGKKVEQEEVDEATDVAADEQMRRAESDEEDGKADTLGTMLRQLGIAPETLGWDEGEEIFLDK